MSDISLEQFDNGGTITREAFRRIRSSSATPVPAEPWPACVECSTPLSAVQVKRGGRFCSLKCSGAHNARIGNTLPQPALKPPSVAPVRVMQAVATEETHDPAPTQIAAALVEVLLAIPGAHIEIHVGPIDIEVRR